MVTDAKNPSDTTSYADMVRDLTRRLAEAERERAALVTALKTYLKSGGAHELVAADKVAAALVSRLDGSGGGA